MKESEQLRHASRQYDAPKSFGFFLLLVTNDLILREPGPFIQSIGIRDFDMLAVRIVLNVAFIAGLLALGVFSLAKGKNPSKAALLAMQSAAGLIALCSTIACRFLAQSAQSEALLLIAFAAYGLFAAAGLLFWVLALLSMGPESAWFHIVVSLFASAFAYAFFLFAAKELPAFCLFNAVYAASFAANCLAPCEAPSDAEREKEEERQEGGFAGFLEKNYRAVLCITGLNFVLTASRTSLSSVSWDLINVICASGIALAAIVLFVLSFCSSRKNGVESVYQASFPILAVAFLLLPFAGSELKELFMLFATTVGTVGSTALFLIALRAPSDGIPAIGAYGLFSGFMHVFLLCGLMASLGDLQEISPAAYAVIASLIVYSMFLILFASQRRSEAKQSASGVVFFGDRESFHDSCRSIAEEKGLSKREAEIMEMVILGKGVDAIAENLCISTHTVRTHNKNIYKKLGVHTKAELLELVSR